jgi:hypothetical protein
MEKELPEKEWKRGAATFGAGSPICGAVKNNRQSVSQNRSLGSRIIANLARAMQ